MNHSTEKICSLVAFTGFHRKGKQARRLRTMLVEDSEAFLPRFRQARKKFKILMVTVTAKDRESLEELW